MAITTATEIQAWIDGYTFVDNGTASRDILANIVRELQNHSFTYGPVEEGYVLSISGPLITQEFTLK
jgi:hypothetical protein